jgi:hypothetical protein
VFFYNEFCIHKSIKLNLDVLINIVLIIIITLTVLWNDFQAKQVNVHLRREQQNVNTKFR